MIRSSPAFSRRRKTALQQLLIKNNYQLKATAEAGVWY
jgi:hypothetical protein